MYLVAVCCDLKQLTCNCQCLSFLIYEMGIGLAYYFPQRIFVRLNTQYIVSVS